MNFQENNKTKKKLTSFQFQTTTEIEWLTLPEVAILEYERIGYSCAQQPLSNLPPAPETRYNKQLSEIATASPY